MKNFNEKGGFFVFEGIECSGKSTQAQLLYDKFSKIYGKKNIVLTKEPGGKTSIGKLIREFLLNDVHTKTNTIELVNKIKNNLPDSAKNALMFCLNYLHLPETKINWEIINALLFIFDRAAHIEEIIKPALKQNKIIISDRFDGSTIAYQGAKLKNDKNWHNLLLYNAQAKQNFSPDKYILIDITIEESFKRLKQHREKLTNFEKRDVEYFQTVRNEFLNQAKMDSENWIIINGERTIEEISEEIWNKINFSLLY